MRAISVARLAKWGGLTTPSMRKGLGCVFMKPTHCVNANFAITQ